MKAGVSCLLFMVWLFTPLMRPISSHFLLTAVLLAALITGIIDYTIDYNYL